MFSLSDFVLRTVKGMIGNYPDFQAMEYALNWYSRGVITESDLAEIEALIEENNYPKKLIEIGTEKIEESADGIEELDQKLIKPQENLSEEPSESINV